MTKFVLATIFFCVGADLCEEKSVEVEQKACSIGILHAKMSHAGTEIPAKIGVRCIGPVSK